MVNGGEVGRSTILEVSLCNMYAFEFCYISYIEKKRNRGKVNIKFSQDSIIYFEKEKQMLDKGEKQNYTNPQNFL